MRARDVVLGHQKVCLTNESAKVYVFTYKTLGLANGRLDLGGDGGRRHGACTSFFNDASHVCSANCDNVRVLKKYASFCSVILYKSIIEKPICIEGIKA